MNRRSFIQSISIGLAGIGLIPRKTSKGITVEREIKIRDLLRTDTNRGLDDPRWDDNQYWQRTADIRASRE